MNNSENYFAKQKRISPPDSVADDVERAVMSRVRESRPAPVFHQRKFIAGALGVAVVLVLVGNLVRRDIPSVVRSEDDAEFVESKIVLNDHVSIWLEPIDAQEKQK
ncbi:hypothetical protein KKG05_05580 [bacterium]|nr:hypothetical protein [bacterium]